MLRTLFAVMILCASLSLGCAPSEDDPVNIYADAHPMSVPIIVTPSVQVGSGQVILYKATNVSTSPASFRIMFYTDDTGLLAFYKDFPKIPGGQTVSYAYAPPTATLALGDVSIEAPQAMRATFAPIPLVDHNVIRNIVANVQIMRVQTGANGAATLDMPVVVPLSHCNFEPRGRIANRGGTWYWNCAPGIYPLKQPPQP